MATLVTPFTYSVRLRRYVPGAITIVVFEASERTADWSCGSVLTLTIAPVGAASAGAGRAGRASAADDPPTIAASRQSTRRDLETMDSVPRETVDPAPVP